MGTQQPDGQPSLPELLARYRPRRMFLRWPELPVIVVTALWIVLGGVAFINIFLCGLFSLWLMVRLLLTAQAKQRLVRRQYHEAMQLAQIIKWLNPFAIEARWLSGISALALNRPLVAVRNFGQVYRLDPEYDNVRTALITALVESLIETEQYQMLAQLIDKLHKLTSDVGEGTVKTGSSMKMHDQIENYLQYAINAARRPIDRVIVYCALTSHLLDQGQHAKAETCIAQALRLVPACPAAMRGQLQARLAELLSRCGRYEMACGDLQNGIVHEAHRAADADQPATYEYSPKPTLARQAILELEQSPSQKVF
jgi:tetratricopeptide (TPR) repeat protein